MKKIFYTIAIAMLGIASAGAESPSQASKPASPAEKTVKVSEIDRQFKFLRVSPDKKRKTATSREDYVGRYYWSGRNQLLGEIVPSEGMMTVTVNAENPQGLIIKGFDVYADEFKGGLEAYFDAPTGHLVIPNQYVSWSSYYECEIWFWNYTVEKDWDERNNDYGYRIIRNMDNPFYFNLTEDGNLVAGNVDIDKWNDYSYTNEELSLDYCMPADMMPEMDGGGFFRLCTNVKAQIFDPSSQDFYMCGANVNGKEWSLAEPDAKFRKVDDGIYRWEGDVLGTEFKVNNGTWESPAYDFGGDQYWFINMGSPYYLLNKGANIRLFPYATVLNPVVELDMNNLTLTLISGEPQDYYRSYVYLGDRMGMHPTTDNQDGTYTLDTFYSTIENDLYVYQYYPEIDYEFYYSAKVPNEFISLGEPFQLQRKFFLPPTFRFSNFDILTNPNIVIDMNNWTMVIEEGETYIETETDALPAQFYIIVYDFEEGAWVSDDSYVLRSIGDGKYLWNGTQMPQNFYITDNMERENPLYTIGSDNTYLEIGTPNNYITGKYISSFTIGDFQNMRSPSILLDVKNWTITVNEGESAEGVTTKKKEITRVIKMPGSNIKQINKTE